MPKQVMVIEDNDKNRKLVKMILEANKYEVIEATTAEDSLKYLQQEKPDVILLDIQLPNMDGLELIKMLKSNQDTKDIPVVAVTAYAMKGDKERILSAGCDAYISKPIDTRQLPLVVEDILKKTKSNI